MLIFDCKVYPYDWLVVIIDVINKKEHVIIKDVEKLKDIYEKHKDDI